MRSIFTNIFYGKMSPWDRIRSAWARHKAAREKSRPMTKADYEDLLERLDKELDKHQVWFMERTERTLARVLREDETLRKIRNDFEWIAACLKNRK